MARAAVDIKISEDSKTIEINGRRFGRRRTRAHACRILLEFGRAKESILSRDTILGVFPELASRDPKRAVRDWIYRIRKLLRSAGLIAEQVLLDLGDGNWRLLAHVTLIDGEPQTEIEPPPASATNCDGEVTHIRVA
jgi:hypothetical protein